MASLHQGISRERKHCNVLQSIGKETHPRLPVHSFQLGVRIWIGRLLLTTQPHHICDPTQPHGLQPAT